MKPTVVLLHSGGLTSRQWRRLRERLAPRFEVAAPDFLGYRPEARWPDGAPFHFHRDVELIESLVVGPAHLVGHSYGGLIALQFALRRPHLVRSIAVYEPVAMGVLDDEADDYDAIVSNPPLHQGIAEDLRQLERLVADAPRHLAPGGELRLVVQRRVAVERLIARHFARVETLAATGRYRVSTGARS